MDKPRFALHLFAGGGGGILADILSGVVPVCAVEIGKHQQDVLVKRFPWMPLWDDIVTFRKRNPECKNMFAYLKSIADDLVVAGGFPCQDISCAGRGKGIRKGKRSRLWKEFARVVYEIRPRFALVENSPMLTARGLGTVLRDLGSLGYDAEWGVLSAKAMGGRHKRDRMWICARRWDA